MLGGLLAAATVGAPLPNPGRHPAAAAEERHYHSRRRFQAPARRRVGVTSKRRAVIKGERTMSNKAIALRPLLAASAAVAALCVGTVAQAEGTDSAAPAPSERGQTQDS